MLKELFPGVWFNKDPADRWIQQGERRVQIPLRIGVYTTGTNCIKFNYPGRHSLLVSTISYRKDVIANVREYIARILEEDELYEHPISMTNLHRRELADEPHFIRIHKNRIGVYTGKPKTGLITVTMTEHPSVDDMAIARKLAIHMREEVLKTRWTHVPGVSHHPYPPETNHDRITCPHCRHLLPERYTLSAT